jgi:N-acetylmuramoyl-L-alanine amidase
VTSPLEAAIAARTIWGEARGEGPAGMRAVAHVLLNRLGGGRWGANLFDVCLAPYQFSCWLHGDPNRPKMIGLPEDDPTLRLCEIAFDAARAARDADPTAGATHYYADTSAPPTWAAGLSPTAHLGHHLFFAGVK